MSAGFYRTKKSRRFANMHLSKVGPAPKVERVEFRKVEQKETAPMDAFQKALHLTIARKTGEMSDADIAGQHQTLAMEMFPDSKNIGIALSKFYKTDVGKIALGYAAQAKYGELQETYRSGDGDIAISKIEREEPADKEGDGKPKLRHAHPKKKPQKATSHDNYTADADPDPNRVQNTTYGAAAPVDIDKFARYADAIANEYAAANGVTKDAAYSHLLKSDRAFGLVWRAALTLPQSE